MKAIKFRGKRKKLKDQFVLVVGDDGAILCHYMDSKLSNRIFLDTPDSADVVLLQKLLNTYPSHPISILVDVIEQNYTQSVLPPVSKMGVVAQVQRRMKRDLRQDDLNNFMLLGRLKEGRKDWSVLFISLANADPFKKWADFVLSGNNKINGIYLLPIEATPLNQGLRKNFIDKTADKNTLPEWEILILHNKCGGFRIVVFKQDKIVFTRLAQNIIGDSIPEVVVGNLEQEIQNSFEYIKRLGFRNDSTCRTTIISATEILEKMDVKAVRFGEVCLLSPFQASEMLGLPDAVAGRDKFADILAATHFAATPKHILKFHNKSSKKLEQIYLGIKALGILTFLIFALGVFTQGKKIYDAMQIRQEIKSRQGEIKNLNMSLVTSKDKLKKFDIKDIETVMAAYNIRKNLPQEKYQLLEALAKISSHFGHNKFITGIRFASSGSKNKNAQPMEKRNISEFRNLNQGYELYIDINIEVNENSVDDFDKDSQAFLKAIEASLPGRRVTFDKQPIMPKSEDFESLVEAIDDSQSKKIIVPATIKIESNGEHASANLQLIGKGGMNA